MDPCRAIEAVPADSARLLDELVTSAHPKDLRGRGGEGPRIGGEQRRAAAAAAAAAA